MSHVKSDPAFATQFRRQWNGTRVAIKFLSEMSATELDRLALERGAAAVAAMPRDSVEGLTARERRERAEHAARRRAL